MTTYTTQFNEQLGGTDEKIDVTIVYDTDFTGDDKNDIKITLSLASGSQSGKDDIIGVAFDIGNDAPDLSITDIVRSVNAGATEPVSTFTPLVTYDINKIGTGGSYIDPGFNTSGEGSDQPYDIGIKFSDQGDAEGIVQTASFVLSKTGTDLDAEAILEQTDWWVRLQSTDNGGSAKTGGFIGELDIDTGTPSIDVEKLVSVDGGVTFVDADTVTGPFLLESGDDPIFKFVVANTGNVALTDVTLSDSDFNLNLASFDLAANDGQAKGADEYEYIFTDATWQAGQHTNTATVEGTYNGTTVSDEDDANYFGADPEIDVEKYVSVDGGATFKDADELTGDFLLESGADPIFKFVVANTGNVDLEEIALSDSDFDLNGAIVSLAAGGTYETTITAPWEEGQHTDTATVETTYTDDAGNESDLSDSDDANYFGANPAFDIQKYVSVDGGVTFVDADTPTGLLSLEDYPDPIFKFVVTNTGNVDLEDITLSDSDFDLNGAAAGTDITIASLAVGGTDETTITAPWQLGQHTNTATIETTYTDDAGNTDPLTGMDDANYFGVSGPGVRTPGFWSNWTAVWNRNTSDDSTFKTKSFFSDGDILVYKHGEPTDALPNGGKVIDPVTGQLATGLLIGDYNQNGTTDGGEETIFYSLTEALKIVNASQKTQQDVRYTLDRSLVASWLNYLAGNPGDVTDMDNAIDWLQALTPDETGDGAGDGYIKGLGTTGFDPLSPAVAASSAAWNSGIGSIPAGSQINYWLDRYNNYGIGSEGQIALPPL
jgi:hypothetical protein